MGKRKYKLPISTVHVLCYKLNENQKNPKERCMLLNPHGYPSRKNRKRTQGTSVRFPWSPQEQTGTWQVVALGILFEPFILSLCMGELEGWGCGQ
jgi:hypothetical protein